MRGPSVKNFGSAEHRRHTGSANRPPVEKRHLQIQTDFLLKRLLTIDRFWSPAGRGRSGHPGRATRVAESAAHSSESVPEGHRAQARAPLRGQSLVNSTRMGPTKRQTHLRGAPAALRGAKSVAHSSESEPEGHRAQARAPLGGPSLVNSTQNGRRRTLRRTSAPLPAHFRRTSAPLPNHLGSETSPGGGGARVYINKE